MPDTTPFPAPRDAASCAADCLVTRLRVETTYLAAELVRLDRRGFLTQTMLAGAALTLAACGVSGAGDAFGPASVGASIQLASYPALSAVGGVALVSLNGAQLALVRTGTSTFLALSRVCPHEGATVNVASGGFTCPRHGAHFDTSGTWLSGQRTGSMRSYPTTYDAASGTVAIG